MLLVLEGEVQVDAGQDRTEPVPISVLGPGDLLGEMSLIDGAPRSATCTAMSPLRAAALSRRALETLFDQHPRTAAKLMMGVAHRVAERLRALGQQLQMLAELSPPR
jgi:CRP-like cAMP-binding protein